MEPSWIITLNASSSPPSWALPPPPALSHLDVFTSRTTEDGRDRFRLHLGYFEDLPSAKIVLNVVREAYPAAWLVPASRYRPLRLLKGTTVEAGDTTSPPRVAGEDEAPANSTVSAHIANLPAPAEPAFDEDPILESAEIFALLEGASDMLTRVLPDYRVAESPAGDSQSNGDNRIEIGAAPDAKDAPADERAPSGPVDNRNVGAPESPLSSLARFIIEEWQPEARRPSEPRTARAWYSKFRAVKRKAKI